MKSAYPKVTINLLGNLHQEKVYHVPIDDQDNLNDQNQQLNGENDMQDIQSQPAANDDGEIDIAGPIKQKTEMRM